MSVITKTNILTMPKASEKVFEISVSKALNAVGGGIAESVILGVGNGVTTLIYNPKALNIAYKAVLKIKDIGPLMKGTVLTLSTLAAPLLSPLIAVGSAILGLYQGGLTGYNDGAVKAVKEGVNNTKDFHKETTTGLKILEKKVDETKEFTLEDLKNWAI
ncbi:MAG: hypothetical protein HYU63_01240 [Armatimonadetes bacterium]|nr:hypothetical protein [Armatimonadota bacterium]